MYEVGRGQHFVILVNHYLAHYTEDLHYFQLHSFIHSFSYQPVWNLYFYSKYSPENFGSHLIKLCGSSYSSHILIHHQHPVVFS